MSIYLNYDGIPGDVSAAGHEQWIELTSFQWGVGRGISNSDGSAADREGSIPSVSEIVVTKDQDSASTNLMRAALGKAPGDAGKTVKIDFVRTAGGNAQPYLQLELTNTLVSGWSISGSGGDNDSRPAETVTLNFTAVTFSQTGMNADGSPGTPDRAQYDMTTQTGG